MEKNIKHISYILLPAVFFLLFGSFFALNFGNPLSVKTIIVPKSIENILDIKPFHSVCISYELKEGSRAGKSGKYNLGCNHNNITLIGLNITRNLLGPMALGGIDTVRNHSIIGLGNATAHPGASDNVGFGQSFRNNSGGFTANTDLNSNGLARLAGNWSITNGQNGNWSLCATFTATGSAGIIQVNVTGLFNQSQIGGGINGTMIAVSTFNDVSLDTSNADTLTPCWIGGIA